MSTLYAIGCPAKSVTVREDSPAIKALTRPVSANNVRKRKHGQLDESSENWEPFDIQSSSSSQPKKLIPKLLLPRSQLPLAYLDLTTTEDPRPHSRLFSAKIGLLDTNQDDLRQSQSMVLIAQDEGAGPFFAIEQVRAEVFVLCRLGAWVTQEALRKLADAKPSHTALLPCTSHNESDLQAKEWWRFAAVPSRTASQATISAENARTRARDFRLSLKRPLKKEPSPVRPQRHIPGSNSLRKDTPRVDETIDKGLQQALEVLKGIRTHYLEALYLSRTSLAYFAKGPLSRARACFQSPDASARDSSELTQWLRTMILTLPAMDRKYRETIPNLVKQYPSTTLSEGELASTIESVRKKSRRSKRDKINKDGLVAGEEVSIAHWWLGRDLHSTSNDNDEAREESIKTLIREQRAREAQLQIIVLLETLALEANAADLGDGESRMITSETVNGIAIEKKKKCKKPQDLNVLLDLLADRLCIWHTMDAEPETLLANQHRPSSFQRNAEDKNDGQLRQFCVDVILPFYGARLPGVSALLCQKLGGPKSPSPKRPPPSGLEAVSKPSIKPGAPIPRLVPLKKPRRTLERVLTDDKSRRNRQAPTLARSNTEPVLPVKREVSDISLSSIPLSRVTVSKRYSQREVDLRAASQATEAKQKKKMIVEQELQGAIAAIKRPDPRTAGREFADTVEQRQAGSRSRKSRNPVGDVSGQCLQVMATPSRNRHAAPHKLPSLQAGHQTRNDEIDILPPSSVSRVIPSSTRKVPTSDTLRDHEHRSSMTSIDRTPTRNAARFIDSLSCLEKEEIIDGHLLPSGLPTAILEQPEEPCKPSTAIWNIQETPAKKASLQWQSSHPLTPDLQAMPCKRALFQASQLEATSPSAHPEMSAFYTSLGWSYEVDD